MLGLGLTEVKEQCKIHPVVAKVKEKDATAESSRCEKLIQCLRSDFAATAAKVLVLEDVGKVLELQKM